MQTSWSLTVPHATYDYYRYTRNSGAFCAIKLGSSAAGATGLGFSAASAADEPAPYGFRPRVVYVLHTASQRKRAVPVATPAAFATLTGPGEHTINMPELQDVDGEDWVVIGGREEHAPKPHRIHP